MTVTLRRRITLAIMAVVVALVALIAIPLGIVGTRLVRSDARAELQRDADAIAVALQLERELATPFTRRQLQVFAREGQRIVIESRRERRTVEQNFDRGGLTATATNDQGDQVIVETSDSDVSASVARVWALVAGLAAGVVLLATGAAAFLSRRLAEPMAELADVSRQLGRGDFDVAIRRHDIAEIDAVAVALADSARRIADLMSAERDFSANASHQLRTVITGLRLQLDELDENLDASHDPQGNLAEAQRQVDRLERTVEELLTLARGQGGRAEPFDLYSLAQKVSRRWNAVAADEGRHIAVEGQPTLASASSGAVEQALDTLVDNALVHGQGTISLVIATSGAATIVVEDEGAGVPPDLREAVFERGRSLAGRSGLGLGLARNLVESEGGRLRVVRPAAFEIQLPLAEPPLPPPR